MKRNNVMMVSRCAKDAEQDDVECGDGALTTLWGNRGQHWAEDLGGSKSRVGRSAIGQSQPRVFLPSRFFIEVISEASRTSVALL